MDETPPAPPTHTPDGLPVGTVPGLQAPSGDPLDAVRASLDEVLDLPVAARVEVLEEAHRLVVAELRALETG